MKSNELEIEQHAETMVKKAQQDINETGLYELADTWKKRAQNFEMNARILERAYQKLYEHLNHE